jgi:hypothetical protein
MKKLLSCFSALVIGIIVIAVGVSCGGSKEGGTSASAPESPYAPLLGRWLRPDGGYVLAINRVDPDGTADAAYYNPNPIRVSRAMAASLSCSWNCATPAIRAAPTN